MMRAFSTSATGMMAQETLVDVIANNLANVNTTGFKRSQVEFQDLLYSKLKEPGTEVAPGVNTPTGLEVGTGVRVAATLRVFSHGPIREHRTQSRHLDSRQRLPAGPDAERRQTLHARRRAADQRQRAARDARRLPSLPGDRRADGCGQRRHRRGRRRQRDRLQRERGRWWERCSWPGSSIPRA